MEWCQFTLVPSLTLYWWYCLQCGVVVRIYRSKAASFMCPHTLSFPGRMTCHPNAPPPPRHSTLMHPHRRMTPSLPPTPTTAAIGMIPRPITPQTPSPASATVMTPASHPSPARGAQALVLSTPMVATPPQLPLRRWWWQPAQHHPHRRWPGATAQSAGSLGFRTPAPMPSARPHWSGLGLFLSWCQPRAVLAHLCRGTLAAESWARALCTRGVKTWLRDPTPSWKAVRWKLTSQGCCQPLGQLQPCCSAPQLSGLHHGRHRCAKATGHRGPSLAAGSWLGPPPSLASGLSLLFPVCFVGGHFCSFGSFREVWEDIYFSFVVAVLFLRG